MKRAIFLDRDGTLIEDRGHLRSPSEVVFFLDTARALQLLQRDFKLFIVTNQRGIADGLLTVEDVDRVNGYVVTQLAEAGVQITDVYTCPHRRSDGCTCIKPNPYFLEKAAADWGVVLHNSFTIGDHPHDVELASNVGAQGVYVMTGHGARHRDELPSDTVVVSNIGTAADWILRQCVQTTGKGPRDS